MINRLIKEIQKKQAPIVVGLDPTMKFIPGTIKQNAFSVYGETLQGAGEATGSLTRESWMPYMIWFRP